jgi:hypothetical protein
MVAIIAIIVRASDGTRVRSRGHSAQGEVMSEAEVFSNGRGKPATAIYVNTREFEWPEKVISYEQVYALAFPNEPLNDGDVVRIEFSRGHNDGGAGSLQPGEQVNVKKDMVFDVYVTVRS